MEDQPYTYMVSGTGETACDVDVDEEAVSSQPRFWTSALTSPLDDLADNEVIEVLEEALCGNHRLDKDQRENLGTHVEPEVGPVAAAPFTPIPWISLPARNSLIRSRTATANAVAPSSSRTAVSLITLVLAIRTRPTYRHILSTIPSSLFGALLAHLVVDIGAIHLVHLLLHDISTRSFGRLEIVREALNVCCRTYVLPAGLLTRERTRDTPAAPGSAGVKVDKRHILNLLEMLDDSYFCPSSKPSAAATEPCNASTQTLEPQTLRALLTLAVDDNSPPPPGTTPALAIDACRLVRIARALAQDIVSRSVDSMDKEDDIWLLQQTLLRLVRARKVNAGRALHKILLDHRWIIDDPCLRQPATTDRSPAATHASRRLLTPLGVCIALINTLNYNQQPIQALSLIELAVRENMVKPHSRLAAEFEVSVNMTCRIVIASRSPVALQRMASVLPRFISRRSGAVSPRVVKAFYEVCDEQVDGKGRRAMKWFVRGLWEYLVDVKTKKSSSGNSRSDHLEVQQFLPTGRALAHLLKYMAEKSTPWLPSEAAMLRWVVRTISDQPTTFLEPMTVGDVIVVLLSFDESAMPTHRLAKSLYERIADERSDTQKDFAGGGKGIVDEVARDRLRRGLVTHSEAMIELVKASVNVEAMLKFLKASADKPVTPTPTPQPVGHLDPATIFVQRYIQYSPPLAQLSVDDLARLARAFFLLGNVEAGVRMIKYIFAHRQSATVSQVTKRIGKPGDISTNAEDPTVRVLQWALSKVPSSVGEHYLELLDLAFGDDKAVGSVEVVTGKRLFLNVMQKGSKALELCQMSDQQHWKDRLDTLREQWKKREIARQGTRVVVADAGR
ncbi:hypothetical protein QFC19_008631 [Naganishia cerealis]|uniref:Uncharacterized protein n=1 Tax=Naganishia cerealis TaxID=610337 RepID=A0ACC2V122_9TREE|nr:hypothetical protein QFC19_008631 [Naganishia cerealis]